MFNYDSEGERWPPWSSFNSLIYLIEIEDGVTSIGTNSFIYYKNLTQLNIDQNVEIMKILLMKNAIY